ncbi:response regulator transcription factor [Chloroflexota bacterium]
MAETENIERPSQEMKHLVAHLSKSRADAAMWNVNLVVLLFAVLIIVIIMVSLSIDINIVGPAAFVGLIIVWIMARRRSKHLFERFYTEELSGLEQGLTTKDAAFEGHLTSREIQILNYIAKGYTNKRIALEIDISANTVKNFISGILTKLNAADRTEAVVTAIKHGIISTK